MQPTILTVGEGRLSRDIAIRKRDGATPGLTWLGGYRSNMLGAKAQALDNWAGLNKRSCCRHDYSGHGESRGEFMEGTISRWFEESLAVFDRFAHGRQILIGSSMGAWIALLMARELIRRKEGNRLQGLLLLAPAPDFTHELLAPRLTEEEKERLKQSGYIQEESPYCGDPNIFTRKLLEDGTQNRIMTGPITTQCPVHIIQGMRDREAPCEHAIKLMTLLPDENVVMTLVKDGDHRLSREEDIRLMLRAVETLSKN